MRRAGVDHGRRRALRRIAAFLLAAVAGPTALAWARDDGSVSPDDAARRDDDPGPAPVAVGSDRCPYCSMSVIDARFAAQQVTATGRVHVYDAIECLVDHVAGHGGPALTAGWCFVADYAASSRGAATLVSVHDATILHHARLRTPMGGGLVGFGDEASAADFVRERGLADAHVWSWDALVTRARERPWVPAL